jgi:glycosyltransferase involved in cell wall biosynthesis
MPDGMTNVGLIARADNRGLGQQTWAFYRHMQPAKTLVVDCPSQQPLPLHLERFPGAEVVGIPTRDEIRRFLDGLDTVYTAETGYTPHLWDQAHHMGVRTILHANYEFLDRADKPTVWAAPSTWHLSDFPTGTVQLPVPIETERFPKITKPRTARRFLHPVGRPAIHDRNGTADLVAALSRIRSDVTIIVTCQQPGYVDSLLRGVRIPDNVTLMVHDGDDENYWDKYRSIDAMILPRRFGGLCLPLNEAIGAGIPTIMPDIAPNNDWLPRAWLVPAEKVGDFNAKQRIAYYRSNPVALADRIDTLASSQSAYAAACAHTQDLASYMSWDALKPEYDQLCSASA